MLGMNIGRPLCRSLVSDIIVDGGEGGGLSTITAMVMGQSEMEYLFNTDIFYRAITQPTPGNGNLIVVTQFGNNAAPVRTVVNSTTVAANQVNPAMAALSAFLAYVEPTKTFVLGDGSVEGTSRYDLSDDSTDGSDSRIWNDFASVANNIATNEGSVQNLIECWYNADAARINDFRTNFWPFYFGSNADGSNFALGGTVNTRRVDRCLYDSHRTSIFINIISKNDTNVFS
jgi:hypothetical protein